MSKFYYPDLVCNLQVLSRKKVGVQVCNFFLLKTVDEVADQVGVMELSH